MKWFEEDAQLSKAGSATLNRWHASYVGFLLREMPDVIPLSKRVFGALLKSHLAKELKVRHIWIWTRPGVTIYGVELKGCEQARVSTT